MHRSVTKALIVLALSGLASCSGQNSPGAEAGTHISRAQYRHFWNETLGNLAAITVGSNYAAMAAVDGDRARASRILEYSQRFAESAESETAGVPHGWNTRDIGGRLRRAEVALSNATLGLRHYLDHGKPSDLAAAQNDQARAAFDLMAATSSAQKSYKSLGGKPSDLETLQSKTQSAIAGFDSMMGASTDDDQ
ncbi:MAG: hypothetical protein WCB99_05055 [Candidatus Cybelea sp.]|jgi:hypothetical protein